MVKTIKIATCQLPDVFKDTSRALSLIKRYAVAAQSQDVRLLVFPECFLSGYQIDSVVASQFALDINSKEFKQLLDGLKDIHLATVVGFMERTEQALFNSAAIISSGKLLGLHRKNHLLGTENNLFSASDHCQVYQFEQLRFGINICNDLNDESLAASLRSDGANLLVCPTNNMLPTQIANRWKDLHNPIRSQRASVNKLWIASSDVTGTRSENVCYGSSSIINPSGTIVRDLPSFCTGLLSTEIPCS